MSTRGAIGFRLNGQDKLSYNHSDSYPSWLGVRFVDAVKRLIKDPDLKVKVEAIKVVDGESTPTAAEINKLNKYTNLSVSTGQKDDWYCLLREQQGKLEEFVESGYMVDGNDFVNDSLFCEYAYILNLDENIVEFYQGFNKNPKGPGRYSRGDGRSEYCGIALVGVYPMDDIPADWDAQLFSAEKDENDE